MILLFEITLDTGAKYDAFAEEELTIKKGDFCLILKDKYTDYGQVTSAHGQAAPDFNLTDFPKIEKKASLSDKSKANENFAKAKSAYKTALTHIEKLKLQMKLLNAHYSLDRKIVFFQFTADGRIDFRQLVKDLSQSLNTRIELRQIGVRDETSVIGGLGVCGQVLCCKRFLKDFDSINVKMAKEQDLSLNPVNISGMCGRLKCCLKYEHEGYLELDKDMPRRGACCECPDGCGRIVDRNLLTQRVTVCLNESSKNVTYPKDEVRVVYPDKYKIAGNDLKNEEHKDDEIPVELAALDDSKELKNKHKNF